jgi:hypothetical protein
MPVLIEVKSNVCVSVSIVFLMHNYAKPVIGC